MLSLSTIKGSAAYYAAEENYYAMGELESVWMGEGADRLGLSGPIDGATLDAIAQGKLPDGTELSRIVDGKQTHRTGYDLTFSAPKSVSVMALVAGDERFLAAHHHAVAVAMKEVEALASTRIMTDGVSRTETTGNIVAGLYTHDTSRELDPQLHTHSLVLNATWAEGKWRALASDTKTNHGFYEAMLANQIAIGKVYRHALRQDIEAMGFETEVTGKHGMWELKGVPTEPFSQRSQQINDAVGPDASPKSRDVAALDTRKDKAVADPDLLIADWRDRLGKASFVLPLYLAKADERAQGYTVPTPAGTDITQAVSQAISILSDKKVQFSYSELLAATVSQLPAEQGLITQAREGIEQAIGRERLIPLDKENFPSGQPRVIAPMPTPTLCWPRTRPRWLSCPDVVAWPKPSSAWKMPCSWPANRGVRSPSWPATIARLACWHKASLWQTILPRVTPLMPPRSLPLIAPSLSSRLNP